MTVPIRNTNKLNIDLNTVKDPSTREALDALLRFVNALVGTGLATTGDLLARSLNLASGGAWKSKVFTGRLGAGLRAELVLPGKILGMVGMCQSADTEKWVMLTTSSTLVVSTSDSAIRDNVIVLKNNEDTVSSSYRCLVFYSEDLA